MNSHLRLELGSIGFNVYGPSGVDLVERDGLYAPFLRDTQKNRSDIDTTLSLEPAPDISSMPLLFDTDETWAAFADGDDIVLRLSH